MERTGIGDWRGWLFSAGGKAYQSQLALKRLGAPVPPIELFKKPASATAPAEGVR